MLTALSPRYSHTLILSHPSDRANIPSNRSSRSQAIRNAEALAAVLVVELAPLHEAKGLAQVRTE